MFYFIFIFIFIFETRVLFSADVWSFAGGGGWSMVVWGNSSICLVSV